MKRAGYGDEWEGPLPVGSTQPAQGSEDDDRPVAVLYLPNPEYQHGWQSHFVYRDKPKPPKRLAGFRR